MLSSWQWQIIQRDTGSEFWSCRPGWSICDFGKDYIHIFVTVHGVFKFLFWQLSCLLPLKFCFFNCYLQYVSGSSSEGDIHEARLYRDFDYCKLSKDTPLSLPFISNFCPVPFQEMVSLCPRIDVNNLTKLRFWCYL